MIQLSARSAGVARARLLGMVLIVLCLAGFAPADTAPVKVDAAIEKAKKFIYDLQQPGGRWEKDPFRVGDTHIWETMQGDSYGGYTALATYALLAAGESPNDPRIKSAINFLKHCDMIGVYAIGLRLQVWLLIPHESAEIKGMIHKDTELLLNNVNINKNDALGSNNGLWDYSHGKGERVDHSVSQYGVLGLWAAQQSGVVDVGASRWKLFEGAWRRDQHDEGGWSYEAAGGSTASMTAAGVATLFITADYLHSEEGIACTGTLNNPWIDRGLDWMDKNYDSIGNSTYTMYGIERIGTASGYRFFGSHDWFAEISQRLVASQQKDGSWVSDGPGMKPISATCFALLFLARGEAPVLMNKLDYHLHATPPGQPPASMPAATQQSIAASVNWNERPRDLANLATFVGRQTETYRNWQIVNLQAAPIDLHDAPILYMSGKDALDLSAEDVKRLKLFVQQGGMILANADCGRPAFAKSFEALGRAMFGGSFRELPAQHPAYTHEQFPAKRWRVRTPVLGLTNGVRELMILLPSADPARWWQSPAGAAGHEEAFELGTDLYQYAIDRQLWNKGGGYVVRFDDKIKAEHKVKLGRIAVGPNWDPEPGGWTRLATILHNQDSTDLSVLPVVPGQGGLAAVRIAHLTGTTAFSLSNPQRLEIKSFVENGGTLVVDAAGGALPFADSAEQELKIMFGAAATRDLDQPLPASHPVYNLPGHAIAAFTYRAWARQNSVGALKGPRMRGINVGNRIGVFASRDDLSAGLVGEPVDGIVGYSPDSATDIMRNIILYSIQPAARR
jgi:hypothetical protein